MVNLQVTDPKLRQAAETVCRLCRDAGGRAWVVGGGVRDTLLGRPLSDIDIEVHGLAASRLDYAEVVDPDTFAVLDRIEGPALGVLAVHLGPARLIDNLMLTEE